MRNQEPGQKDTSKCSNNPNTNCLHNFRFAVWDLLIPSWIVVRDKKRCETKHEGPKSSHE
jgi:hypothetical protein